MRRELARVAGGGARCARWIAGCGVATVLVQASGVARAASPTTADCLAASDASLKSDTQHSLRAERAQLLVCAAPSCPADIRKECVSRVDQVNAQIPTIVFAAKDASGADLRAVRVAMDSEVLTERLEGTALAVDPGEHTFTFEAAGQPPVTEKLLIQEAQKDRREVIAFGTAPAPPMPPPVPPPPVVAQPLPAAPVPRESPGMGTQKILAFVAGGVGVVGLGVGTVFGVMAISMKNDAQSACPGQCTTEDGVHKWNNATSTGNVSTVGFIVGGVAIAGAAVLWLTAPSSNGGAGTQVGLGPGMLQVKGGW